MTAAVRNYAYHVKPRALILASFVAAFPGTILFLFGLFVRGPLVFTYIYFGLSTLCFLTIVFMLHTVMRVHRSPPQIFLSEHALTAPRSQWSSRSVIIQYAEIESVSIGRGSLGRALVLACKERPQHVFHQAFMEGKAAFDELYSAIDFLISSGNAAGMVPAHRRVPCTLCGNPVLLPDAELNSGKCAFCAAKTPADFRIDGLYLVAAGLAFEAICAVIMFAAWAAGGDVIAVAAWMILGLVAIFSGIYGLVTGRPVKSPF